MNSKDKPPINSRLWWEDYFANQWDAHNGRAQTDYFMRRLVENLPPPEREYLASRDVSLLDWGCAFGDGVAVLAESFPRCRVTGIDFAERAVSESRRGFPQHDFRQPPEGKIGDHYDVIVTVARLAYFPDPLSIIREHLRSCRGFYAALAPYREAPLQLGHVSQFREECFPERLEGFTRVAAKVVDCGSSHGSERMILVVYGSAAYLRERDGRELQIRERRKWDDYYASLPMLEIDDATRDFGEELADRICELLPCGGKVLEAGCGAGWQSLALAQKGRFQLTLMDFSTEALGYAERSFARYQLSAEFVEEDVFATGEPKYDLVFNAGVLEHYTFDQQVSFLRGMASRSANYVLALVPNRKCYWYWMWRMQRSARGNWPFGKEMPMADMSAAFEAAGLRFLGHWFGGGKWSEFFIKDLNGIDGRLRDEILAVHRSSIVPEQQRAYLVAALGCRENVVAVPSCWEPANGSDFTLDQLTASLADSLSATVAAEHRCKQVDHAVAEREKACDSLREELRQSSAEIGRLHKELAERELRSEAIRELAALKSSRGYRLLERLWWIRSRLVPVGGRIESAMRLTRRAARRLRTPRETLKHFARRLPRPPRPRFLRRTGNTTSVRRYAVEATWPAVGDADQLPLVPGLVSVVLPVYNHARLLRQAVESVLAQSYRPIELIIVNDGSTDGVEKVLAEYAGHPPVRVLTQPNQGLPKALSNGFEFARGEFWTWTSADNLMHPDQLRLQVKYLQTHAEAAMVYADYTAIDDAGRPLRDAKFRPQNRRFPHDAEIHLPDADSFGRNVDNFIGPCFLYRGRVGQLLGEYDPVQGIEDFDYWLRISLVGRIAHLDSDQPLYRYRVHDDSLSGRAAELKIYDHAHALMDHHRARKEYFAKPWTIYADAATLNWLKSVGAGGHRVVPWTGEKPAATEEKKCMLLLHAGSLPASASRGSGFAAVAAWFPDGDDGSTNQFGIQAAATADLCFAGDDSTAAKLATCVPRVFRAGPGPELLVSAVHWANNRVFFEATRTAAQRARALPRAFRPEKRSVRVLLQVDNFLQGGLEQVVIDLARSLATERFDVSLLVLGRLEREMAWAREAGITILRLPENCRADHYRRLLRERRIDLVNAHYSLFGAQTAAELGVPFVQTIHNTYVFFPPEGVAAYQANDPFTCAYACVSRAVAWYSAVVLGLPSSKMVVTPNGVDVARLDAAGGGSRQAVRRELGLKEADFVFLNVGAIQPVKLHPALVQAFAAVKRECPEAKLVLVGRAVKDEYLDEVRRAVSCHGLEDSVILAGLRDDVPRFYAAADAFVLPSLFEGWSLALAEALVAGLPVAATSVGSAPELLPQVGGRLVQPPFGSIANLNYHNMDRFAADPDPRFVAELAGAMKEMCQKRPRPLVPERLRRSFDCREAYKTYGHLFLWLLQGGSPIAARAWTNGRETPSLMTPSVEAAVA